MNPNLRGAFLVASLLLTPSAPQTYAQSSDMSGLVKSSIDAVGLIVVSDASGKAVLEGRGFLVSSDGRIVTNHHVIAGAVSAIVN